MKRFFVVIAGLVLGGATAFAESISTNLENGALWVVQSVQDLGSTNLTVGGASANNRLEIFGGGVVSNNSAVVGSAAGGNTALVSGGRWINTGTLTVGSGAGNAVTVEEGGAIFADDLQLSPGGAFNLNESGQLTITDDFNVDAQLQNGLAWNGGGSLVVEGELTLADGLSGTSRTLWLDGGAWNPAAASATVSGTNNSFNMINGAGVTNGNGLIRGSGNRVLVAGTDASWVNHGTLTISNSGNSATVSGGGMIRTENLDVLDGNEFNLNAGGTLAITSSNEFNVSAYSNLNWNAGGNLSVAGELTGTAVVSNDVIGAAAYIQNSRTITLSGPSGLWSHGDQALVLGYDSVNTGLAVEDGARVDNAVGYIGWGGSLGDNTALVSGDDSIWVNAGGELYVGAYPSGSPTNLVNSGAYGFLTVSNQGLVVVGPEQVGLPESGLVVASAAGATLVVGNGEVNVEDTLYLGLDASLKGTNVIRRGGTVAAGDLAIAAGSLLDLQRGGTLALDTDFDVRTAGFVWNDGAEVEVGGEVSGMPTTNFEGGVVAVLDRERDLTLDGGSWTLGSTNAVVGFGAASELVLRDGAALTGGDFRLGWQSSNNVFQVLGGSSADTGDSFIGGTNSSANFAVVYGTGSVWTVDGDLMVGDAAAGEGLTVNAAGSVDATGNTLMVQDAGLIEVSGQLELASGNRIDVFEGSELAVGGNLLVSSNSILNGSGTVRLTGDASEFNLTGANILFGDELLVQAEGSDNAMNLTDGVLSFSGDSTNRFTGFQELNMNNSILRGSGTLAAESFGAIRMNGGTLSPSGGAKGGRIGRLQIAGDFDAQDAVYLAQVYEAVNDELVFSGAAPVLTGLTVNVHVFETPRGAANIISGHDAAGGFAATNITDSMLLYDARLVSGADGVSVDTFANNKKFSSALTHAGAESARFGMNAMKGLVFTHTKQLRRNMVATSQAISREAYLLSATNAPAGARGPGEDNTVFDMNLWVQQFSGQGEYDADGASHGFTLHNDGTTFGFDKVVSDGLVIGMNYTYALSSARTPNRDKLHAESYWLGTYGEWVGESGLYVDAIMAWSRSNYDSERRENSEGYVGTATFRGSNIGVHADVGQYYHYKNLAVSPYAGLHYLKHVTEEYTEEERTSGNETFVDDQSLAWLEAVVGIKLRHRFDTRSGRFQTTGFAEYSHDMIQDDIYATLSANGLPSLEMAEISPDSDIFSTGLGFSWIFDDHVEIGIGYNGRFSDRYTEHTGSAMLNVMF